MSATMSKKEKKQLRKQMMQRKAELIAKHGSNVGRRPGDSGAYRTFSDVKPKLPSYTPSPSRPKPVIKAVTPPKPAATRKPRVVSPAPAPTAPASAYPTAEDRIGETGPGVLQRSAARVEAFGGAVRRGVGAALRWRPPKIAWHRLSADATASGFGTLASVVWPLRLCGLVAVGAAVKLALEAHSAGMTVVSTALVLGMGVALAVVLIALAEIARALRHLADHFTHRA